MIQSDSSIELSDDKSTICIKDLCISEPEICGYISNIEPQNRATILEAAMKLGITALKTMSTTENVDYVEKNFNSMKSDIRNQLNSTFGEDGKVKNLIDHYFGEEGRVQSFLNQKIGENGEFARLLTQNFGPDGRIIHEVFDPDKPNTPLFAVKKEIMESIDKIREGMGIKSAEDTIKEKTALKGTDFEEELEEMLGPITRPLGDVPVNVSTQPGLINRSKKGDFVVEISDSESKIVIEAKDSNYSIKKIDEEIKEAIENRDAEYGIFISKYLEDLPSSVGWFNEYGGKYLVIATTSRNSQTSPESIVEIAYKWARIKVASKSVPIESKEELEDITDELQEVRNSISKFRKVRTYCTNVEDAITGIRSEIKEIEKNINNSLDLIIDKTG